MHFTEFPLVQNGMKISGVNYKVINIQRNVNIF